MLGALLCNQPYTLPSNGCEDHYKRRPNEPVKWCDDEIRCQEELTAFKAKPEHEQEAVALEAIDAIKAAEPITDTIADAQEAIAALADTSDMLRQVECLNVLLLAYFELRLIKRREDDDIAAMLMLGML